MNRVYCWIEKYSFFSQTDLLSLIINVMIWCIIGLFIFLQRYQFPYFLQERIFSYDKLFL